MKIHHLNCATLCPRIPDNLLGHSHIVCHCVLIETNDGLVLVDTGLGTLDLERPRERLGRAFTALMNPRLERGETALRQVELLGFQRADVRHIVMTHLDVDHAGGIADFPDAQVHVLESEYDAAVRKQGNRGELRYRSPQCAQGPKWIRHSPQGERWFGFDAVQALSPVNSPDLLLIPLFGHSLGHCGVAIRTGQGWLLHAGDAYFFHGEMNVESPRCSLGLNVFQKFMQVDGKARLKNLSRLRELKKQNGDGIAVFCAHDPLELKNLQEAQI